MAKPKQNNKESIVCPIIKIEGQKHVLDELFDGPDEDVPELKAVGYAKVSSKAGGWISYVVTFKGDKVTKVEASEPDLRTVIEETCKIDFVQQFMDEGL